LRFVLNGHSSGLRNHRGAATANFDDDELNAMQVALYVALLACCIPLSRAWRPPVATKPQSWRRRMAAADGEPSAVPGSIPGPATVAEWHTARRRAILAAHPEVAALRGPDKRTVPYLVLCNALQLGTAVAVGRARALPWPAAAALAVGVGGTLSLHSFACLHDLLHGTAAAASSRPQREALLFWLSQPNMVRSAVRRRRRCPHSTISPRPAH